MSIKSTTEEAFYPSTLENSEKAQAKQVVNEKAVLAILSFLLIASFVLRLYRLGEGLWLDEIITYLKYARLSFFEIITTYDSENQHFLYSLLARASLGIFGDSAWALRLPAVLFGVGSIWAVYLVGKEAGKSTEGLLAAALLTFSYHHVWFSQNARGYSGLLFWTLLSSWFLLRALRENRLRLWFFYALSAALGIYTHMTMGFVVAGQFLVFFMEVAYDFLRNRRSRSGPTQPDNSAGSTLRSRFWMGLGIGFGLAGLFTLLLHLPVLGGITGTVGGSEKSVVTAWKSPLWTVLEIIRGLRIGFSLWIAGVGALVLFAAGFISFLRTRPAITGLLVFPPVLGAATVIAIGHHLWPRFFYFALGFAALVLVRGIFILSEWTASRLGKSKNFSSRLGLALCAGLILLSMVSLPAAYGPKQDYENAYRFIESNLEPGDQVVTVDLAAMIYRDYIQSGWQEVDSLEALEAIREQASRTWVVYTFPPVLEAVQPEIMASLQQDFQPIREFPGTVSGGTVYIYRSDR